MWTIGITRLSLAYGLYTVYIIEAIILTNIQLHLENITIILIAFVEVMLQLGSSVAVVLK